MSIVPTLPSASSNKLSPITSDSNILGATARSTDVSSSGVVSAAVSSPKRSWAACLAAACAASSSSDKGVVVASGSTVPSPVAAVLPIVSDSGISVVSPVSDDVVVSLPSSSNAVSISFILSIYLALAASDIFPSASFFCKAYSQSHLSLANPVACILSEMPLDSNSLVT